MMFLLLLLLVSQLDAKRNKCLELFKNFIESHHFATLKADSTEKFLYLKAIETRGK